jgi:GNAT superfamily N-acetyltransferase
VPPEIVVRFARCDEQKSLEDLQRRASLVWEEYREALLAHPDAIELPMEQIEAGRVFVAERQDLVLGFGVVLRRPDGDAELDGLFVAPAYWRQGIGRVLIFEAGRLARSEGAHALFVIANPKAREFYEACGFEMMGEAATRFGPAFTMRKPIMEGGPSGRSAL